MFRKFKTGYLFFLILSINIHAQDSILGLNKRDSVISLSNNINISTSFSQTVKSFEEKVFEFCIQNDFEEGIPLGKILLFQAVSLARNNQDSILKIADEINREHYHKLTPNQKNIFKFLESDIYFKQKKIDYVLVLSTQMEELADKHNLSKHNAYSLRARAYSDLGEVEKGIKFYKKALDSIRNDDPNKLHYTAITCRNIAVNYTILNQFDSTTIYLKKALDIKENDIVALNSLVINYTNLGLYDKAELTLNKVEQIISRNGRVRMKPMLARYIKSKANLYLKTNRYKKATVLADSLIKLTDTMNQLDLKSAYILKVKSALGEDAYIMNELGELYNNEKRESVLELSLENQVKYETAEKEKEIELLKAKELERQLASERMKTTYFIVFISLALLVLIIFGYYLYQKNKTQKELFSLKNQALRLQINPHFFFNAMNSISAFIVKNKPQEANNYLVKFSKVMRLSLENVQEDVVPLQKEIDFVTNYMEIEKLRNKNFDYTISVDEAINTYEVEIPPIIIQPYIENAIVHAFVNKTVDDKGVIAISFSEKEGSIAVSIADNGIGMAESKKRDTRNNHKSLALSITQKRLNAFSKNRVKINYTDGIENGTVISFLIPIKS